MAVAHCEVCGKEYPNGGLAKSCAKRHKKREEGAEATEKPTEQSSGQGEGNTLREVLKPLFGQFSALVLEPEHLPEETQYLADGATVGLRVMGRLKDGRVEVEEIDFIR